MGRHLQRALWAARLLTVCLGLGVVALLVNLQHGLLSGTGDAVEAPPGAEREGVPGQYRTAFQDPQDVGVGEDEKEREEHSGQQEVAFSLARISSLLGWGGQDADEDGGDHVGAAEEADADRIRIKDWRPLDELGLGGARGAGLGQTTEWSDSTLLRAFIARFGTLHNVTPATGTPSDLDAGEMADFVAGASPTSTRTPTTADPETQQTTLALLPFCPLNGIITSQDGQDPQVDDDPRIGDAILQYSAAWLVARGVGPGWRTALVPEGVLRQLSQLFQHLSLSALEQLPPRCRPQRQVLEDTRSALAQEDLGNLQALPVRFLQPENPLVVRRGVLLPHLLVTHLSALREELSLLPHVRQAARFVLDVCRQRVPGLQDHPGPDGDDEEGGRVAYVALHVRRHDVAAWWPHRGRSPRSLEVDYFRSAMEHFRLRMRGRGLVPVFVVATDDPEWARDVLPSGEDVCVTSTEGVNEGTRVPLQPVDFAVQALCQHAILDRSSTALAAAVLIDGEVVGPEALKEAQPDLGRMPGWTFM